ncbi:hypothetical protein BH20ACT3_BH20ACT3_08230 [soil metagenome]
MPEGFWQVVYTKAGYRSARSEVLEVLPPHFDVNVAMTPLAVPTVADVGAMPALLETRTGRTFGDRFV